MTEGDRSNVLVTVLQIASRVFGVIHDISILICI